MKDRLISWLNQLLMLNVFLVLLSFVWFAIAVFGRSIGVALGFDLWYSLWEPLFMPAIGILMAGAIMSGLINQISKRLKSN
jgi:TRAP-type C4-dicarboxylate transport system permease small subunit